MRDGHLAGRILLAALAATVAIPATAARAATDLRVSAVERVQVVQTATQAIPLVLGKAIAVRVYVDVGSGGTAGPGPGGTWTVGGASLEVYRGSTHLGTLSPFNSTIAVNPTPTAFTVYRREQARSFNFRIPESMQYADGITIVASINNNRGVPETDYTNNTTSRSLTFVLTRDLRFKAEQYASPDHPYSEARWEDNLVQARRVLRWWPSDRIVVYGRGSYQIWQCCPTGDPTDRWWPGGDAVVVRANRSRAADDTYSSVPWYVLTPWDTCICGLAYAVSTTPTSAVGQDNGGPAADTRGGPSLTSYVGVVMAQEIAHAAFGQLHTGHVDDFADPACCEHGMINGRYSSTLGFDPIAMTLIPAGSASATHAHDFMSYGAAPIWVSDYSYLRLLDAQRVTASSARAERAQPAAKRPYLLVTGTVGARNTIDPAYAVDRPEGTADGAGTGAYALDLVAGDGRVLFTRNFDVRESHSIDDTQGFSETIPYDGAVQRLVLRSGDTILATLERSANAPTVEITRPAAGAHWEGARQAEWRAADADGDRLTYLVQYSADGGRTWETVGSDITETSLAIDAAHIKGSRDCRIRVLASDGLNTTVAVSQPFGVERHRPVARILGARIDGLGQAVLEGNAYDADDVIVAGARIVWRSNRDGRLGTGESLTTAPLSPGRHRVTLTVTDASGARARAVRVLEVARMAPRAPRAVRAHAVGDRVRLRWSDRRGNASRYVVQRARRARVPAFATVAVASGRRRAAADDPPRGVHLYRVGACRRGRCTFSRPTRARPLRRPPAAGRASRG